jgi:hypothetical protein
MVLERQREGRPREKYDAQSKIVFDVMRELMTPLEKPKRCLGF